MVLFVAPGGHRGTACVAERGSRRAAAQAGGAEAQFERRVFIVIRFVVFLFIAVDAASSPSRRNRDRTVRRRGSDRAGSAGGYARLRGRRGFARS